MVKKIIVLMLMVAAVYLVIAGCGGSSGDSSSPIVITSISEVGTILTGDSIDVIANGNYLYYVGWGNTTSSFGIIDFSDPANPAILSTMDAGGAYGIDFDGRYAFVETDGGGTGIFTNGTVGVIDCLDPNNPVEVMENNLGSLSAYDSELSGNYYYNFSFSIIGVYDVSTPTAITHVTNVATGGGTMFGRAVGNYLYAGNSVVGGLDIFDISDPATSIPLAGHMSIPGVGSGATASGTTAFIAGNDGVNDLIYSVDVSDPANPVIISTVVTPSKIQREMRIVGNYLLAAGAVDFVVIDISDPASMTLVDSVIMGNAKGWGFDVSGRYAIVGDDTVLRIIQLY